MKTLVLVTIIMLAMFAAPADAQTIPINLHGVWCASGSDYYQPSDRPCEVAETEMRITAHGFEIVDGNCTALKVTQFDVYPWGRRARKNPWGPGYRIKFKCLGEGVAKPLITEHSWTIEKGALLVQLSKEKHNTGSSINTSPRR
jgi:hypothetical protein